MTQDKDLIQKAIKRVKDQIKLEDQTRISKRSALTTGQFYLGDIEEILEALSAIRGLRMVDVEWLENTKRIPVSGYNDGWNECLDHLTANGYVIMKTEKK